MNKIKKIFAEMADSVKKAIKIFPITTILIFSLTLIIAFLVIGDNLPENAMDIIGHITVIGAITAVGTWFVETVLKDKNKTSKIITYILALTIAIFFDRIARIPNIDEQIILRWLYFYMSSCVLISIYALIKRSDVDTHKYILNLTINIRRTTIIYGILTIGFLILYMIFTTLILENLKFDMFLRIYTIFTGFYYIPVVLKAFTNEETEESKFSKTIFSKVLFTIILLAIAIIYIYIVKALIQTEIPKNRLFGILSFIFICAWPVYIINKNYTEKESLTYKINNAIPYLHIPFILLQIYAIGIRINEYGLTESRYAGCILILFEIIAISLSIYKNGKHLKNLLLACIAISFVVFVSPFNSENMSMLSQKKVVDQYVQNGIDFDKLSKAEKKRVASAYKYIENDQKYVNPNLSKVEKEKLSSYNNYGDYYENQEERQKQKYVSLFRKIDSLDILEYIKIYEISSNYNDDGTIIKYAPTETNQPSFTVDLKNFVDTLIAANENSTMTANRIFKNTGLIDVEQDKKLYITQISFNYDSSSKKVTYLRIQGYLFEK